MKVHSVPCGDCRCCFRRCRHDSKQQFSPYETLYHMIVSAHGGALRFIIILVITIIMVIIGHFFLRFTLQQSDEAIQQHSVVVQVRKEVKQERGSTRPTMTTEAKAETTTTTTVAVASSTVKSKRLDGPKIYVYSDFPSAEYQIPTRIYFQLEYTLLQAMRQRGRITTNPSEATHFWIPHALVANWIDRRPQTMAQDLRAYMEQIFVPFLHKMVHELPYYNQTNGRNHVLVWIMDEGPVCEKAGGFKVTGPGSASDSFFQKIIQPMRVIGYHGQRGIQSEFFHNLTCWTDGVDIAVPQWHTWNMRADRILEEAGQNCIIGNNNTENCNAWLSYLQQRASTATRAFYFRGSASTWGHECSVNIRPWIGKYCSQNSSSCFLNNNHATMTDAVFALSPAGWACWSSRLFDAFYQLVIPVVLADGMVLPFEKRLNWTSMSEVVRTGSPVDLPSDGGPQWERLERMAATWISTCRDPTQSQSCLDHTVSQKMLHMLQNRKYFGWQPIESDETAFYMLEQELLDEPRHVNFPSSP